MNIYNLKNLLAANAEITVDCLEEDTRIRGNVLASGNSAEDKTAEDAIIAALNRTPWAWCCVKVTATFEGFTATDYLGCCSYEDEKEFRACPYFADMRQSALDNLAIEILTSEKQIESIRTRVNIQSQLTTCQVLPAIRR